MSPDSSTSQTEPAAPNFQDLPRDELLRYGQSLGLELSAKMETDEMARAVRRRHELLHRIDREALLDVIIWSRRPVRRDAAKEELAREIARVTRSNYDSLSRRGLHTLAQLRGLSAAETDSAEDLIARLQKQESLWQRWSRKRRSIVGGWIARMLDVKEEQPGDYRFLPDGAAAEENGPERSLRRQIEDYGVVGGIASRLRGAADDYIKIKLDEIESRIDDKLNQIDQRLAEWRDREVANRLKILRITLAFTVLVAILSLGYNFIKSRVVEKKQSPAMKQVSEEQAPAARDLQ